MNKTVEIAFPFEDRIAKLLMRIVMRLALNKVIPIPILSGERFQIQRVSLYRLSSLTHFGSKGKVSRFKIIQFLKKRFEEVFEDIITFKV